MKSNWPIIVAVLIWIAVILGSLFLSTSRTEGRLVYALDDAYIHMAMAGNFVEHDNWGVTRYEFTSSSSSILWTLALSGVYSVFGVTDSGPLALNFLAGLFILILSGWYFRRIELDPRFGFAALAAIIFLTPLPALAFSGMEHIVHLLLVIPFVVLASRAISAERTSWSDTLALALLAALVNSARYEGLFMVLVVCLLLLARRRLLPAVVIGLISLVPLVIYGLVSMSHGWYFLPNSVLVKGKPNLDTLHGILFVPYYAVRQMFESPHVLLLVMGNLGGFIYRIKRGAETRGRYPVMVYIYLGTVVLHYVFARIGWFYRYEAYLVGLGLFMLAYFLKDVPAEQIRLPGKLGSVRSLAIIALALVVLLPFGFRGVQSLIRIPQGTKNIHEQQYQMGLFLKEYYQGEAVAVNDLGAVNYLADIRCLDLWGLGTMATGQAQVTGTYDSTFIDNLTRERGVKIAILYDNWFEFVMPLGFGSVWTKAGRWRIVNNKVCGDSDVIFYAVDSTEAPALREHLREFSDRLPPDVIEFGPYTRSSE